MTETKEKTKLPEFTGKPLVQIPKVIPQANFLVGDFGQAVLEEYQGIVNANYQNNRRLRVLQYNKEKDIVEGSNPFAVVLVNDIVKARGVHVATPAEIEAVLRTQALPLAGTYEDTALVLRSEDEPNSYLARKLIKQLKKKREINLPLMIPLRELEISNDQDSPYGLVFTLKDSAQPVYSPILGKDGNFLSEDINQETGLPRKTGDQGNRHLWTRSTGLSRLCLGRGLGLSSYFDDLAGSDADGRVVVVGGEAAEKNLEERLAQEYKAKQKALEEKY